MKPIARSAPAAIAGLFLVAGAAGASTAAEPIRYGCGDLVVVGRVRIVASADPDWPGDLLGHGRYSMQVRVKQVLRGKEARRLLPVTGQAHGQMREGVDFWLVLTHAADGGYAVRTANLTRLPHRLAAKCD